MENKYWKKYDIIYVTRMQKERFNNNKEINIDNFIINKDKLSKFKEDVMIMHPLPRNEEINPEIDNNRNVYYFKQMENSVYVRMILIDKYLSKSEYKDKDKDNYSMLFDKL